MVSQQQLIQLLSGTPDNLVYHILTLLVIQATLGISIAQWRRDRRDQFAWRLTITSVVLLLTRLILLAAVMITRDSELGAMRTLPPVEQALNTLIAGFVVWALAAPPRALPRLNNLLLITFALLTGVLYVFFAQEWATVETPQFYSASVQGVIWSGLQIGVLSLGLLWVLFTGRLRGESALYLFAIALFLGAHILHAVSVNQLLPTDTEIPFWIRLGHLVTFPLLAVIAYRHSVSALMIRAVDPQAQAESGSADLLALARQVIAQPAVDETIASGLHLVNAQLPSPFIGIGIVTDHALGNLQLTTRRPDFASAGVTQTWSLNLGDWPGLRLALKQRQTVELSQNGLGARQLRDLYEELNVSGCGTLLIEPLLSAGQEVGVLLLGGAESRAQWQPAERGSAYSLAGYLAAAINQASLVAGSPIISPVSDPGLAEKVAVLEKERNDALAAGAALQAQLARATAETDSATQRTAVLQDQVDLNQSAGGQAAANSIGALQSEVTTLRESLVHAEEALAIAAAGEQGLSADWVMRTITRYSGELEEAQSRMQRLEHELATQQRVGIEDALLTLLDELRTPMTSIAGYTDMLLGEAIGSLSINQRKFLQRVRSNVDRMRDTLDQVVALASRDHGREDEITADPIEVLDVAIDTILKQLRDRDLRLDLKLPGNVPPVAIPRDTFYQVIAHLLNNACHVSARRNHITLQVQVDNLQQFPADPHDQELRFLRVAVLDHSVGVEPALVPHVFEATPPRQTPFVPGLAVAYDLVRSHGGRMWLNSELRRGNVFSALFPVATSGNGSGDDHQPAGVPTAPDTAAALTTV